MRFLRRNAEPPPSDASEAGPEATTAPSAGPAGKGRPTPKRREAEARRRGPVAPPPRTQREALRRLRGNKEERRAARSERRQRMLSGDDRYLLPRDRGPVRAYVRDLVDSQRHLMGLFMPMAVFVLLTLFVPDPRFQYTANLVLMAMLAAIIVEAIFLGRQVNRRVRRKFPDTKDGGFGLAFYAISRATYLRRLRMPRPRVTYGEVTD